MTERVFDTKKHSNVKRKAEYRRIDTYFKSLPQTKKERARDQRVLELWMKGWDISEIALEVGVSKRTVNRVLKKLQPLLKRRFLRLVRCAAEEERVRVMKFLDGLCPAEQANWISQYLANRKASRRRRRKCRRLLVMVDADAAVKGQNALRFKPRFPALVCPYVISFQLVVGGKGWFVGQVKVD